MPTAVESQLPRYRWVIEALVLLMLIGQVMTWLAPAPILRPMVTSLGITLGSAGLIISVIALCIGVFSFLGAFVAQRLGTLRALLVGIWLMAIAEIVSGYAASFGFLLLCRVLEGVGYGVIIGPPAALVMQWFGEREWPYVNMVNALCAYVGITLVYAITPAVFFAMGSSWQSVLKVYGVSVAIIALAWTLLGRERHAHTAGVAAHGAAGSAKLSEVIKMRGVVPVAIALFGGMWVFQLYTAFLPEYFRSMRQLSLEQASNLTAMLPLAGIFAAAAGGLATAIIGLRKPFLWPLAIVTFVGCGGAVLLPGIGGIRASLILVGIGAAGGLAATSTLMMELPGMTPDRMGTAFAFVWAVGYVGAFIAPFLGGALAPMIGLRNVMVASLALEFMPITCLYLLPETGPGRRVVGIPSVQPAA
jgi:MFS family permease